MFFRHAVQSSNGAGPSDARTLEQGVQVLLARSGTVCCDALSAIRFSRSSTTVCCFAVELATDFALEKSRHF